jgi:undecaprenyl pyrophosphate phosphatase UppP
MRIEFLALYGGPDQIMTVTSSLAAILGVLLIFWNKLVSFFFKAIKLFHRSPKSVTAGPEIKNQSEPERTRTE